MTDIRWARPTDRRACNSFYNSSYGRQRTDAQWDWGFVAPSGGGHLPYVTAFQGNELVGTQAYVPIYMIDEKGVFLTAKSEETLVSSSMRGKNLLNQMYDLILERAPKDRIASIWGFTPAEKAFLKLGFDIPMKTKLLVTCLSPKGILSMADDRGDWKRRASFQLAGAALSALNAIMRLVPTGSLRNDEELRALDSADDFSGDYTLRFHKSWGGCTINRDATYMQWRLFDNPYRRSHVLGVKYDGKLIAHIAFCVDDAKVGRIIDLISAHPLGRSHDKRIVSVLLRLAVAGMRDEGATAITSLTVTEHAFDRLIREAAFGAGFVRLNRGSAVVFHTGLPDSQRNTSHDDFNAWFVTNIFTEGQLG